MSKSGPHDARVFRARLRLKLIISSWTLVLQNGSAVGALQNRLYFYADARLRLEHHKTSQLSLKTGFT
jgi:hypothetical protein